MQKFRNIILCGDCIEILRSVGEPFADLIFADPPFNIGYQYDKYRDRVEKNRYLAWTRDWMSACLGVLKPTGSFYIAIGDDYAAHVRLIGEDLGLTLRNWIIWHYTFGQQTRNKFARSHTHIFYFVKNPKQFTFNDWAVRVPSDRQLVYNDKRAQSCGKLPDDVWNTYSRVCGTFRERQGWHPCQMPELLLARIISASSNPGDCVLDPFVGSGTTAAAAFQLGRDYCGIDISEQYVENTRKRLTDLQKTRISGPLSMHEMLELKRLVFEIGRPADAYQMNEKLTQLFCRQFAVRMNNCKHYKPDMILPLLPEICPCQGRK
ncbi:MAG TPA: site-specific DNA-methyltransferase [Anaerohalosphaeraceae bacterium]|nr:site-specific DNA-methyltransferase [Anaerohalosphaeraceae bacterium]HOL87601.1 site-specific DNA-methyltransferase [Anaerohalosphaeraceae bacterium]HPP56179.1 site-specific DNA-methyltransferase [Anaerohalosphaeraceae bacterium]